MELVKEPNPTATVGPLSAEADRATIQEFIDQQRQEHQREVRILQHRIATLTAANTELQRQLADADRREAQYADLERREV